MTQDAQILTPGCVCVHMYVVLCTYIFIFLSKYTTIYLVDHLSYSNYLQTVYIIMATGGKSSTPQLWQLALY